MFAYHGITYKGRVSISQVTLPEPPASQHPSPIFSNYYKNCRNFKKLQYGGFKFTENIKESKLDRSLRFLPVASLIKSFQIMYNSTLKHVELRKHFTTGHLRYSRDSKRG